LNLPRLLYRLHVASSITLEEAHADLPLTVREARFALLRGLYPDLQDWEEKVRRYHEAELANWRSHPEASWHFYKRCRKEGDLLSQPSKALVTDPVRREVVERALSHEVLLYPEDQL
jgi:hypothetical protein